MSLQTLVLWLSGIGSDELSCYSPLFSRLREQGALVGLRAIPIVTPPVTSHQLLTGNNPGRWGMFDVFSRRGYEVTRSGPALPSAVQAQSVLNMLESSKFTTDHKELKIQEVPAALQASDACPDCVILKCDLDGQRNDYGVVEDALEAGLRLARAEQAGFFVVSDFHRPSVRATVNINNLFLDVDLIAARETAQGHKVVEWAETLVYHMGHGQIWVNLLGREPAGIVSPGEEYERVRDVVVKTLSSRLINPATGESVVESVYKKEALYQGDFLVTAPDLVAVFKTGYGPSRRSAELSFDDTVVSPVESDQPLWAGVSPEAAEGFLLTWGEGIRKGYTGPPAALIDFAPTLLYYLGAAIAKDIDGRIIEEIFEPLRFQQYPARYEEKAALTDEEEVLIAERLRALGYL